MAIAEYYKKKNKILLNQKLGGLGDVFLCRMLIKQIKKQANECTIDFSCQSQYFDAINDHPLINNVFDAKKVDTSQYGLELDFCVKKSNEIETIESSNGQRSRAEIWADRYNIKRNFDMMLHVDENVKDKISHRIKRNKNKLIGFCPVSKMAAKTLTKDQQKLILNILKSYDLDVIGIHNKKLESFDEEYTPNITDLSIKELIALVDCCDYVISVDTSCFHIAGGLEKPLVGIFTYTDGYLYGKHYEKVIVQKHKRFDTNWECGPCHAKDKCQKSSCIVKPCLTELNEKDFIQGIEKMFNIWPTNN